MRAANGAGLAANQVGERVRIAVIEVEQGNPRYPYKPPIPLTVIVNPVIEPLDDETVDDQRGLPVGARPARRRVERHVNVRVRYLDRDGDEHDEVKRGLTAGTFQHEVDHLDGMLFVDRGATRGRSRPGSSSSGIGRDEFVAHAARERSVGARRLVTRATGASSPGSAASAAEAGVADRGRRRADRRGRASASRGAAAGAERLAGPHAARPRQRALARLPARAARAHPGRAGATSGPGASRCTSSPSRLDPDTYFALARATFAEMALAGITGVGEFHYLHHAPDGAPYDDPNAMGAAVIAAAREAGIRITLLDACYLHGGIGRRRSGVQRRFSDGDAERVGRARRRARGRRRRRGSARRSTASARSTPSGGARWPRWAGERGGRCTPTSPSSRPRTRPASPPTGARRPSVLADAGALSARVHRGPRHAPDRRRRRSCSAGRRLRAASARRPSATSPTASGPARRLRRGRRRGSALGTDSHAVIDLFEEARAVELDERLATGERGRHAAAALLRAATADGYARLGWPEAGRIEPGALADLVDRRRSTACAWRARRRSTRVESVVFAAGAADVRDVIVGGRARRPRRARTSSLDVAAELGDGDRHAARHELAGDRQHRPAGHQRPGARRGPARDRPRRRARDRGRPGRRGRARRARRPTSASTPAAAA